MIATATVLDRTNLIDTDPSMGCYVYDEVIPAAPQNKPAEEIILLADVMPKPVIRLTWSTPLRLVRWLLPVYVLAMLLLAYDVCPLLSSNILARIEFPVTLASAFLFTMLAYRPHVLIGRKTYQ